MTEIAKPFKKWFNRKIKPEKNKLKIYSIDEDGFPIFVKVIKIK